MLNLVITVEDIMGLTVSRNKRIREQFLIIKISGKNNTRKRTLMVVVILVVHINGRSG